jgi:hypothetical protein
MRRWLLLSSLALHRGCARGMSTMAGNGHSEGTDFVRLGEKYGKLANAHDFVGIRAIISPSATIYGFKGPDAIIEGMTNFRRTFKQVMWRYPTGFKQTDADESDLTRVEFLFNRYWTDEERGVLMSTATEYIDFTSGGLMQNIGLVVEPTAAVESAYPLEDSDMQSEL